MLLIRPTCLLSLNPLLKGEGETGLRVEATPEGAGVETDLAFDWPLAVFGDHGHVGDFGFGQWGCPGVISSECARRQEHDGEGCGGDDGLHFVSPPETVFSIKNKLPVRFGMEPERAVHLPFRFGSKPLNGLRAPEPSSALSGTPPFASLTGEGKTFWDYRLLPCLLAWEKVPDRADEGSLMQVKMLGRAKNKALNSSIAY